MYNRPKPGEDDSHILQMQEDFHRERKKNLNLQPASQVTNLHPTELKRESTGESSARKISKYAEARGLKRQSDRQASIETETGLVIGEILEKNLCDSPHQVSEDDDKVYYPKIIPSLLGNIIEKNFDNPVNFSFKSMPVEGFPVATKRNSKSALSEGIPNSFVEISVNNKITEMDVDLPSCPSISKTLNPTEKALNLPKKSYVLSCNEANLIHNENVNKLRELSEKEILEEQQKLLSTLDPKIVNFLNAKRKKEEHSQQPQMTIKPENIDFNTNTADQDQNVVFEDTLWENNVLSHPNVSSWLHFNSLEKDKLEWMKGIKDNKKVNVDEPYEARFDFNGYLLPYTLEYTENTRTLFHHGEEYHRPGYSLSELFDLVRSSVIQQRAMALNTIAGVLEYYSSGTYKDILEIPLSKVFFIVRIAMDENKVLLLEPALKAMRNLLVNRIDEACLDALVGFEEGTYQPCLENDKLEIEELDSKESELKDFHLAEIDIITALLRTDILQRFYYILEVLKPSFNCVQYIMQILTRLARDSIETASNIVKMEHVMSAIVKHFVPTTAVNFLFEPQIVYNGKPILSALKLIRVLTLQNKELGNILLSKYQILQPVSEYLSSGVDGTYGLRIQIESFCILSNLLHYGLAIKSALSLTPVIVTALYKHGQGTDIYVDSSVISATHAAVVVQCVNKLLKTKDNDLNTFKHQIYPLVIDATEKWLVQLSQSDSYTCAHLRVLCSVLDCCKSILLQENLPIVRLSVSLKRLALSTGIKKLLQEVVPSSNLLSGIETRDLHFTKNLMSLGSSHIDSVQKVLPVFKVLSPIPFLTSLFKLLEVMNDKELSLAFLVNFTEYIDRLVTVVPSLCDNWFTRIETDLIFSIVKLSYLNTVPEFDKDRLYTVANKLCYILRADKKHELEFLFSHIIFSKDWFTAERLMNLVSLSDNNGFHISSIDDIKLCYKKVVNLNYIDTGPNVVLKKWQEPILPRDWIYLPILKLYSKSQETYTPRVVQELANKVSATKIMAEKESIVTCSLEWILFNELCFPELLIDIDLTDRFCRIMCAFLCDNSLFLGSKIKGLLGKCVQILFKKEKKCPFNFDKSLTGLNNFQDFYTQFLEQFQSVSYGDATFAAAVLVPLAQKHNVKWRKLLWSEYAGCLRALDCPEDLLCYQMHEYLIPEETDDSVIKSYFLALSSNLLRPNTISYRIADHHVKNFKNRLNVAKDCSNK